MKEEFYKFISELRKEQGLTQKALAEKLHVSASTISKWETGVAKPDIYLLDSLAEALNVTTVELISCERNVENSLHIGLEVMNDMLGEVLQIEKRRSKSLFVQQFIICILSVLLLISVIGNGYLYYVSPPRMNIVDEYYDEAIDDLSYEKVYRVIVEYDGRITTDAVTNHTEQVRSFYKLYFVNVDAIVLTYYADYKGREYIDDCYAMSVMLPEEREEIK